MRDIVTREELIDKLVEIECVLADLVDMTQLLSDDEMNDIAQAFHIINSILVIQFDQYKKEKKHEE